MMPLEVEAMPASMSNPAANEVEETSGSLRISSSAWAIASRVICSDEASGVETVTIRYPWSSSGRNPAGSLRHTRKTIASIAATNSPVRATCRASVGAKAV